MFVLMFDRMADMNKTNFFGVSGAVKFDKLGNRMSKVVVEQLRSKFLFEVVVIAELAFSFGIFRWSLSSFSSFRCGKKFN